MKQLILTLKRKSLIASKTLVFLLVGLRSHWKQSIRYFLSNKATATVQAELINITSARASAAGLKVWCVTSDGTKTNISMFKKLGRSFGYMYDTILTKFKHPINVMSLVKNAWGDIFPHID